MIEMEAKVVAESLGGLWVVECSVHGILSLATDAAVDGVAEAHMIAEHGAAEVTRS